MDDKTTDIWFGPGAEKGVFGAGVAHGLQELVTQGELDESNIQLYGSSIGCLTAAFLATGNAECGLSIFQEETSNLVAPANIVPAIGARVINRVSRTCRIADSPLRVPSVLNLDHVFAVMTRKTPNLVDQLRRSTTRVFAETVDCHGEYQHAELGSVDDPYKEIRSSLNYFPFTHVPEAKLMDSVISGYGFTKLLHSSQRPLVIVLNVKPTSRSGFTIGDLACAALSADVRIAKLYLRRRSNRYTACHRARESQSKVLFIYPSRIVKLSGASGFEAAHALGKEASRQIVSFVRSSKATVDSPTKSSNSPPCE